MASKKIAEATNRSSLKDGNMNVDLDMNMEGLDMEGLKAKVAEGVIPKAVANSIESMVDNMAASVSSSKSKVTTSELNGIVKEFTVTGNTLVEESSKKRPRGEQSQTVINEEFDESSGEDIIDDCEEEYSDDGDYDDDEEDHVVGVCLHCGLPPPPANGETCTIIGPNDTPTAPGVQVSCDDCSSFICSACHWCHEYQANHEIRVCDRCDAFYCKGCDEMDQCEDCGEVVCGGCGALCSCKFCGCGLCEDCATACGR